MFFPSGRHVGCRLALRRKFVFEWCCPFVCFSNLKWLNKDGEFKGGGGRDSQTSLGLSNQRFVCLLNFERAVSTLRSNIVIWCFVCFCFVVNRDFWKIELVNF